MIDTERATSTLTISEPTDTSAGYGDNVTVSAALTTGGLPLADQLVSLRIGTSIQTDLTDANGVASVALTLADTPGTTQVAASFAGNASTQSSNTAKPFTINKLGTTLVVTEPTEGLWSGSNSHVYATLKDEHDHGVAFRSGIFVVWDNSNPGFTRQVSTGLDGRAALGNVPMLPVGTYSVFACFNGSITLNPWASPPASISLSDPIFGSSVGAPARLQIIYNFTGFFAPVDNKPTMNQVKAGSAVPVKFSLSGDRGLGVLAAGYPVSTSTTCTSTTTDTIEETVTAGSSSLSYDATTDVYTYVWKTDKAGPVRG